MKMVPRFPERLLTALGASADFRDDVLGDLAEEFAVRAEWDGAPKARRWYYREALRAAPYFLRDARRNMRARDLLGLGKAIVIAMVGVKVFRFVFFAVANPLIGDTSQLDHAMPVWWFLPFLLLNAITPVAGGYIAARAYRKAPLAAAVALGVSWAVIDLVTIARYGDVLPAAYRYGAPAIAIVFTTLGGVVRAWRLPRLS